ncbi:amino acid ABC transporter permease [Comamonas sp. BIGb0124]|uniref:amino acid ABC transporter permease n=1 Tax=Comamonas sp. BIGb0124 TaxID=2485130 RepID=UPI0018F33874|nr:amino acid ABC transporter permease [Comamonas sp. BIGb0124]
MIESFGFPEFMFLLRSFGWTLALTACAMLLGSLIGGFFAIARVSHNNLLRRFAVAYIQLLQGLPVLLVLFLSYFGLAYLGFDPPALVIATVALGLYSGAYLADIWRGAMESVPFQQWEASSSLAMTRVQQFRYIILPQSIRISLPPTVGFLVQLVKNTSIVSVVGYIDLMRAGEHIEASLHSPFKIYGIVALMYFLLCFPLSHLSKALERKMNAHRSS